MSEGTTAPPAESDGAEVHDAGDVLGVDDTDDAVRVGLGPARGIGLALVDRDAGVLLLDDARAGPLDGQVGGEGEDLAARSHDLAHSDVVQLDGAVDDLFLERGKQAHAAGRGGDQLELLGRVDGALAMQRRVEETQHAGSGTVHQADGRAADANDDVHGAGDGEGDALGALQSEGFGDKLTQQEFKVGDCGEGNDDSGAMRVEESVGAGVRSASARRDRAASGRRRVHRASPARAQPG